MTTECNQESFEFHPLNGRQVVGRFDGGTITTDAGGLLLREVEKRTGIIERFAACVQDYRKEEQIEHTVQELVAQREDFRVLVPAAHRQQPQQREHVRHTEVGQLQQHGPSPCHSASHRTTVITCNVAPHPYNGSNQHGWGFRQEQGQLQPGGSGRHGA